MAKGQNTTPEGPRIPTPEEEAQANIMEMEAKDRLERQREADERTRTEAERTRQIGETETGKQQAYSSALNYGQNKLNSSGIDDQYGIMDLFRGEADYAKSQVPQVTSSPGSYFTPSTWYDTSYNTARGRERTKLGNEFDTFAGAGFDRNLVGDNMDDATIDSVLGQQRSDALFQLDNAKARGKFNDAGYSRGMSELENMFNVARSKANDLGGGVLEGYRGQLRTRADNFRNQISSYDFGSGYSNNTARNDITGLAGTFGGRLDGDILRAIGDTNFFDIGKLFEKAGSRTGVINPAVAGQSGLGGGGLGGSGGTDDRTLKTSVF